jgi:heme iron utilization protein
MTSNAGHEPPGIFPGGEADPVSAVRRVMRSVDRATLATAQADAAGWPHPSLVLVAFDHDATPLLLLSDLAEHTRNIGADSRIGLLFDATSGLEDPLAGARASVLGRAERTTEPRHRERFLRRHPGSALYAGFRDFAFYRVAVERAHLVAGFGRIRWVEGTDIPLFPAAASSLAQREADILAHMNGDHADAIDLYATALLGRTGEGWTMVGIDPEGCDLRRGPNFARLDFGRPVTDTRSARDELVRLAGEARRREEGPSAP